VTGFEACSFSVHGSVSIVLMGYHLCTSLSNDVNIVLKNVPVKENICVMTTFGQRLKEERKRLGFTQPDFAAVGGVEKGAQINYEQDKRFPGADYLIAVASLGVDTQYVLLGVLSGEGLKDDEQELLFGYRQLDVRTKARVLGVVEGAITASDSSQPPKSGATVTFHGTVGQQITGNITAPQTINVGRKKK